MERHVKSRINYLGSILLSHPLRGHVDEPVPHIGVVEGVDEPVHVVPGSCSGNTAANSLHTEEMTTSQELEPQADNLLH